MNQGPMYKGWIQHQSYPKRLVDSPMPHVNIDLHDEVSKVPCASTNYKTKQN